MAVILAKCRNGFNRDQGRASFGGLFALGQNERRKRGQYAPTANPASLLSVNKFKEQP